MEKKFVIMFMLVAAKKFSILFYFCFDVVSFKVSDSTLYWLLWQITNKKLLRRKSGFFFFFNGAILPYNAFVP